MIKYSWQRVDLAKIAHVSKAAVTRWFQSVDQDGWVNIETNTLKNLAQGMGLPAKVFLKPQPLLSSFQTRFLWDHLYPDMESFVQALVQMRKQALARLVQVLGFHASSYILGKRVIKNFPTYKKWIHPARRRQLEILWPLYN